jgi:hypothetical protein
MYVKNIEYTGFCGHDICEGAVTLIGDDTRVQVQMTLPHRIELHRQKDRLKLLATALATLDRVPGDRKTHNLRFAPGIFPAQNRRQA